MLKISCNFALLKNSKNRHAMLKTTTIHMMEKYCAKKNMLNYLNKIKTEIVSNFSTSENNRKYDLINERNTFLIRRKVIDFFWCYFPVYIMH